MFLALSYVAAVQRSSCRAASFREAADVASAGRRGSVYVYGSNAMFLLCSSIVIVLSGTWYDMYVTWYLVLGTAGVRRSTISAL